jgi:formylglycine-generating enzyme required for sulfatase activity
MRSFRPAPFALALCLVCFVSSLVAQASAPRYALVIGNSDYTGMPRLRNPVNDARDVAAVLDKLGFAVTPLYNGSRKQMNQAIVAFRESLASDRASEGFFYYAGHGVQAKGVNYLIPVGSDIRSEADLDDEAVSLQRVLGSIEEARNRVNVVILDACRDNPLPAASRSAARGLAVVASAPPESVVLFSTAQNQTAADGEGRNSPFAAALVKYLPESGDISRTIKLVTAEVKRATGAAQTPFQYTSLDFDYQLNRGAAAASAPAPAVATTLTVTRSYGTLVVSASTSGSLYLDGKAMGDLPAGAEARLDNVEAGDRSVELRYATGDKETKSVSVQKGQSSNVVFSWKKAEPAIVPIAPAGMVLVPGGSFMMGSPADEKGRGNNEKQRQVAINAFAIGRTDVTVGEFKAFVAATGYRTSSEINGGAIGGYPSGGWATLTNYKGWKDDANWKKPYLTQTDQHPVVLVSWFDAIAYCNWKSLSDGRIPAYRYNGDTEWEKWPEGWNVKSYRAPIDCDFSSNGYRLPTEAEWEYAAKGGPTANSSAASAIYAGSDTVDDIAWYSGNSRNVTHPVAQKKPNALGLYDMAGNVSQWCQDQGDTVGWSGIRGGSWKDEALNLRTARKNGSQSNYRTFDIGFRLACSLGK